MSRRLAPLLACLASLVALAACGGAAKSAADPTAPPAVIVGKGDVGSNVAQPASARRRASDALGEVWPFDTPKLVVYADVGGLMKTKLFSGLVDTIIRLTGTTSQRSCIEAVTLGAQEMAFGSDSAGALLFVRLEPGAAASISRCAPVLGQATRTTLENAAEAWTIGNDLLAVTPSGVAIMGARGMVTSALAGHGHGKVLDAVTLGPGEYLTWMAQLFPGEPPSHGTLVATDQRFRIAGEADLDTERLAKEVEKELSRSAMSARLPPSTLPPDQRDALARLIAALDVQRKGKHIAITFELTEPPADQLRDLGAAAAISVYAVRKYIIASKQAEARNALGQIARSMVASWEMETADSRPRAKKKLASFPPVPKLVPAGAKYQSSEADWKPWSALRFEMSAPQYYQYEVKAAKDGESADVIARGDLDGNGKASELKLHVAIDRRADLIRIAPSIQETDPDE